MRNRIIAALLVGLLAGTLGAASAQAGWFDKQPNKAQNSAKTHRYDFFPSMSYHMGTLRRDTFSGWKLNEIPLGFIKNAQVTAEGEQGVRLQEGDQVLVMGSKVGETIVAWRVRILEPDWSETPDKSDSRITWSTSDPTVGEGPTTE